MLNLVLASAVIGVAVAGYLTVGHGGAARAQITTGTVQRGSVLSTISASGNVEVSQSLALSFTGTGKLLAVYVQPGQTVRVGQRLARIDDTSEAASVRSARAGVLSAQASLLKLEQPLTAQTLAQNQIALEQARTAVATAQSSLADTISNANLDERTLGQAVSQARVSLAQAQATATLDEAALARAVKQARTSLTQAKQTIASNEKSQQTAVDQAAIALTLAQDTTNASAASAQAALTQAQAQVQSDQAKLAEDQQLELVDCGSIHPVIGSATSSQCRSDAQTVTSDAQTITKDQQAVTNAQNALDSNGVSSRQTVTSATNAYQNAVETLSKTKASDAQTLQTAQNAVDNALASQRAGVLKDEQSVVSARSAVQTALQSRQSGVAKDQQSIGSARNSVTSAEQSVASTSAANDVKAAAPTPGDLASAKASVSAAQAAYQNALAAERQTLLVSPVRGVVASVNGSVGEAPGSGAAAASSSSSSAASGFITLVDLAAPQVLANFSETDAAKIRVGQPATIQVDALPTQQLAAHVVQVAATQTVVSNVVTYGVTFQLDRTAPGLKPGMTVSAAVIVAKRDGVLHVPNAAVRTTGGASTVTVLGTNGVQTPRTVVTGLQGDDSTEIVSGLEQGEQVVVSTASAVVSTGTTGTGRGAGLGGGLGGGGFRGGGFGG